jgi:hypothetical protein
MTSLKLVVAALPTSLTEYMPAGTWFPMLLLQIHPMPVPAGNSRDRIEGVKIIDFLAIKNRNKMLRTR